MKKWSERFKSREEKIKKQEAIFAQHQDAIDKIDRLTSTYNSTNSLSALSFIINDMKKSCICTKDQSSSKIKIATNVLEKLHDALINPGPDKTQFFLDSVKEFKESRPLEFSKTANLFEARFNACMGGLFSISAVCFTAMTILAPVLSPLTITVASLNGVAAIIHFNLTTEYYKNAEIAEKNSDILNEKTTAVCKLLDNPTTIATTQNYKSNLNTSLAKPSVQLSSATQNQAFPSDKTSFESAFKLAYTNSFSEIISNSRSGGYTISTSPPSNKNVHLTVSKEGAVSASYQPNSTQDKKELAEKIVAAFIAAGNKKEKPAQIRCKNKELADFITDALNKNGYTASIMPISEKKENKTPSTSNRI